MLTVSQMVGTVLTFLVIVVQYDQAQSSVKPTANSELLNNFTTTTPTFTNENYY